VNYAPRLADSACSDCNRFFLDEQLTAIGADADGRCVCESCLVTALEKQDEADAEDYYGGSSWRAGTDAVVRELADETQRAADADAEYERRNACRDGEHEPRGAF
jgi:hypothetical protein